MVSDAVDQRGTPPLLTLGRVDLLSIQVGYRTAPEAPAYEWFLLDLPVPESPGADQPDLDEQSILSALEPTLYAGSDVPRHYSLHQHRRHSSWGASPGALELGLLVTTGPRSSRLSAASTESVTGAFRAVLASVGGEQPTEAPREAAILRARRSAAAVYELDPDSLSLSAEEHRPAEGSWRVALRAPGADEYDVVVGFVDGFPGAVQVRLRPRVEVFDSVGAE